MNAALTQRCDQVGGLFAGPKVEVDECGVWHTFDNQCLSLGRRPRRPGHVGTQKFKQALQCIGDIARILDQQPLQALKVVRRF